jgi:hypothetical protein
MISFVTISEDEASLDRASQDIARNSKRAAADDE